MTTVLLEVSEEDLLALWEILEACNGRAAGYGGFYEETIAAIPVVKALADRIEEAGLFGPLQTRTVTGAQAEVLP